MFDFGKNQSGNVAIAFALTLLPTIGLAGAAVDYGRASNAREFMRKVGDQAALSVVAAESASAETVLAAAKALIEGSLGKKVSAVEVTGEWLDDAHYAVRIRADVAMAIVQAVPAMPSHVGVAVETVTRRIPPTYRTTPPTSSLLEPEASDYNRVYMYCYDQRRVDDPDRGRRAATPIADNGTPTTDYAAQPGWALPICDSGEVVSYMLRNVRGARSRPTRWDDPSQEVYEYWADAQLDPETRMLRHDVRGYRVYGGATRTALDMRASPILETVRCRTEAECLPVAQGGIIPDRKTNRSPTTAAEPCAEGMSMYFGWEDRPPGFGWTDRDYDDIRLVVSCPVQERTTARQVRIVE